MSKDETALSKNYRDVQGKTIFKDPILCAQFLRNNIDNPLIKRVKPEDIEDYTERFVPYFGVEFEGDIIKRICIKDNNGEFVFYLISLIEHKSKVDYNVTIQLLKYMVCIWAEYEKEFGEEYKGKTRNKEFCYPPILPIVYYEGKETWTAGRYLRERIQMAEVFAEYIPDFTYELVDIHSISNKELLERKDVMSLIMLLNKIQTSEEFSDFVEISNPELDDLLKETPEQIINILVSVVRTLCRRMNATKEETEDYVAKVRVGNMGYLFENMEPMDIQAERRNTAQARAERLAAEAARDAAMEARDAAMEALDVAMEERDVAMEERDVAMEERDVAMEALDVAVEERDVAVEARDTACRELAEMKEQLVQETEKMASRIQELEALLKKHNIKE